MPQNPSPSDWPDPDQLMFRKVKPAWDTGELLAQEGWFPLADVVRVLDPHDSGCLRRIVTQRDRVAEIGGDPVGMMGLRRFGNHLWADMAVFGAWFHEHATVLLDHTPEGWRFPDASAENRFLESVDD